MSVWRFPGPVDCEKRCASGHVKRAGLLATNGAQALGPRHLDPCAPTVVSERPAASRQRHISKLRKR